MESAFWVRSLIMYFVVILTWLFGPNVFTSGGSPITLRNDSLIPLVATF